MSDDYTVDLKADTKAYQAEMAQSVSITEQLVGSLGRVAMGIANLAKRADRGLKIVSATEAASITAVTIAAGRLDQQMSSLQGRQVMLGQATNAYTKTVTNLRTQFGMTSQDAISLVTQLTKLGATQGTVQKSISSYAKLSAVTGENVNALAQSNTQFMRTMQAAPQSVDRYSSMLAQVSEGMGTSAQSTVDFSNSIAPLSKTLGMSAAQITGISASFAKAGADGGAAANAYTKILSDINDATVNGSPELGKYASVLGKTTEQFKAMPKAEIMTDMFKEISKSGPNSIKILTAFGLEGVRTQKAIQAVAQSGGLDVGIEKAQAGYDSTKGFDAGAEKALNGMNDSLGKISETFKSFSQAVGGVFLPVADKLFSTIDKMLSPLRWFTELLGGLSGGAKGLLSVAAGIGVLLPLLPKLIASLWSLGIVSQLTKGPLAQGALLGRNPGRALSDSQANYVDGKGNAGQRTLFRAGMYAGDMANFGKSRLGDLAFKNTDGSDRDVRSSKEWRMAALDRMGLIGNAEKAASGGNDIRSRLGAMAKTGTISGMALGGQLIRSGLTPLGLDYQKESVGRYDRDAITQKSRWRDTTAGMAIRRLGSVENLDEGSHGMRRAATGLVGTIRSVSSSTTLFNGEVKNSSTIMGQFRRDLGLLGVSVAKAGAGAVIGGGNLVGQAGKGAGGWPLALAEPLLGTVGGAAGLGVMAGLGAGAAVMKSNAQMKTMAVDDGQDNSAGAGYREALGIAADATRSFADIIKGAAKDVAGTAKTVSETLTITQKNADDAKLVNDGKVVDQKLVAMNKDQSVQYAASVLRSAKPEEAQALQYDLINKFGKEQAQEVMSQSMANTDLAGLNKLVSNKDEAFLPFGQRDGLMDNFFISKKTQANADIVADSAIRQRTRVAERDGAGGAARYEQSRFNQFFTSAADRSKEEGGSAFELGGLGNGAASTRALYTSLEKEFGIDAKDKESKKGVQKVLSDVEKFDPKLTGSERDQALQDSITRNLEGTAIGAKVQASREQGGIYSQSGYGNIEIDKVNPLAGLGQMVGQVQSTEIGRRATNFSLGGSGTEFMNAVNNQGDMNKQQVAVSSLIAGQQKMSGEDGSGTAGAKMGTTIDELERFRASVQQSTLGLREMAQAAIIQAKAQRDFQNKMGGTASLTDRLAQAGTDYDAAVARRQSNPDDEEGEAKVQTAKEALQAVQAEQYDRLKGFATQYRNLEIQKTQGQAQMDRGQVRARRDNTLSETYSKQDFDKQNDRSRAAFNLSNKIATASFDRQAERSETAFNLQRKQSTYDFYLQRSQSEEDFQTSRARQERDYNRNLKIQLADYTRNRKRDEADYNIQMVRMAEDSAKTVYDIYSRIGVERSWDAANLLQNMADQQEKIEQQQANLVKIRKMGLSDKSINQLGLTGADKAQQLERLMQDMQDDPKLIAQYNKMAKDRQGASGDLAKEDPAFKRQTTDRQKQLKRQAEDFARGVRQGSEQYQQAVDDMNKDFVKASKRQLTQFKTTMDRGSDQYRLTVSEQNEDFDRSMKEGHTAFTLQMNQASDDFDLLRDRNRKRMNQGFTDQQDDFDYQMDQEKKNISLFGAEISETFVDLQKTVGDKSSGLLKQQIGTMQELTKQYGGATLAVHTEVAKVFASHNIYAGYDPSAKTPKNTHSLYDAYDKPGGPHSEHDEQAAAQMGDDHEHLGSLHSDPGTSPSGGSNNKQTVGESNTAHGGPVGEGNGSGSDASTWSKQMPVNSPRVGTPYGKAGRMWASGHHTGTDFPKPTGAAIYAVGPGVVKTATTHGGSYGHLTKIAHGGGLESWYAHQSKQLVKTGDTVRGHEHIGNVGDTGNTSGPHLHLEIHTAGGKKGDRVDPWKWLKGAKYATTTPGGGSGEAGSGVPNPDFKNLKSIKNLEAMLSKNQFFTNKFPMPATSKMRAGDMGNKLDKDFYDAYIKAHPEALDYGNDEVSGSIGDVGTAKPGRYGDGKNAYGLKTLNATQLRNAATIIAQAKRDGLNARGAQIGLMAALAEDQLRWRNLGDRDSVGGFQQRNAWGSNADRMNVAKSAHMFFTGGKGGQKGLKDINWQSMSMGSAAQKVQGSAHPGRYQTFDDEAAAIYNAIVKGGGGNFEPTVGGGGGDSGPANGRWPYKSSPRYSLGNVKRNARDAAGRIGPHYGLKTIYGFAKAGSVPGSYHPKGRGLDFMITGGGGGHSNGNAIESHMYANHGAYKAIELIWDRHIRTAARGWSKRRYTGPRSHTDHVHASFANSGYKDGTESAAPGWHLVGEHAPEWVYMKGGEKVRNGAQTAVINSKAGATVQSKPAETSVYNQSYDHSNNFTGPISVSADDPQKMQRALEQKARLASLTKPVGEFSMSGTQAGPLSLRGDFEELDFDAEVSYAGSWWTLNDHINFVVTPEGFGIMEQTYRRKDVTSEYFEGTYTMHKVRESTKRTIELLVYGSDQAQVSDNILKVVEWFTEDAFNLRIRMNESVETWLCGAADYKVDRSHVMMHNCMAKITFSVGVSPNVLYEIDL